MASFSRLHVLQKMLDITVIPVFYHPDEDIALKALEACIRAGATVVEYTHRGDFAQDVFPKLVRQCNQQYPHAALGVGSVVEAMTAAHYINNGANFVVGPSFNDHVARLCNRRKVAYIPGCATATEISRAEEAGVEICKVFPGRETGGPDFIKAIKGPMPWSQLMPTGGVENTEESIGAWIRAGACCVGMGSQLLRKQWMEAGDFDKIEDGVRRALGYAAAAKAD